MGIRHRVRRLTRLLKQILGVIGSRGRKDAAMSTGPRTLAVLLTTAIVSGACTVGGTPETQESSPGRVVPTFSNPTRITNRYLPFAERGRWIYEGTKGRKPYLIEVAVTDATKTLQWGDDATETIVVRHRGWVRGRLIEEAFDYYAQGDDGAVWHFGQLVDNYRRSDVVNHDGSWLVGQKGAEPRLLMPGEPQPGQSFTSENVVDLGGVRRDEIVTLKAPAPTPTGQVDNGLLLRSTQPNGAKEEKVFVPGVGEVLARSGETRLRLVERLQQDAESATSQTFSRPTVVDNPYFGATGVDHRLYFGRDEGEPLRIEVSLTGRKRPISWEGGTTKTVVSQFLETSGTKLLEIAVDWFAQDDAGNVWYFGEDVWNYEEGRVANTDGSWIAGKDGPPGMIMPGDPSLEQRFNPENIPGNVFETVDVQALDTTYRLPTGRRLTNVVRLHETLDDGTEEFKLYAPRYGNVSVKIPGIETVDIVYALPNDAIDAPLPRELRDLRDEVRPLTVRGQGVSAPIADALSTFVQRGDAVPPILVGMARRQLRALDQALSVRKESEARRAALDLEQTVLDMFRLYRTKRPVDLDVLDLYVRRMVAAVDDGDRTAAATAAAMAWGVSERSAPVLPRKVERAAAAVDESADEGKLTDILRAASRLQAAIR